MGKSKKIVDGVVVEVDDTQMVKTIENGIVVEKPLNTVKKKEADNSGILSTTGGIDSNQPSQSTSPVPSRLPLASKLNSDLFDNSKLFTTPTFQNLDPVERKDYNAQMPGLSTPEKSTEVIKGIIEKRSNPGVRVSNAQRFISDDMDQNANLFSDAPFPEKFKQQVINGDGADSNVSINRYFHQRNDKIESEIKGLQDQQYVASEDLSGLAASATVKAPNYDELQAQINELSGYKGHLNKYATTLTAYQASKEIPFPTGGDVNAKREANRQVGLKMQDINQPLAAETKRKNIESSVDGNRHPQLVDIENYRLESDGLNARQFALDADMNMGNITHDEYISQSNDITNQTKQLFNLHPEAKKAAQAQAIGQIIQETRQAAGDKKMVSAMGNLFNNVVNFNVKEDEIKAAAAKLKMTEEEVRTQINNKDDIPGTSFLANVYNKFIVSSGEKIVSPFLSLATNGRLRTDAEVEAERYTKNEKFQFNAAQSVESPNVIINTGAPRSSDQYLAEVANPAAGHHNLGVGTLNAVGDALGTLGQLWLATELTGGVGDVALGGTIGAETAGVARTVNALTEVKQLTGAQKALFGNVGGMMLTGYNDNKIAAKQFIPDESGQQLFAVTRGIQTGLLFGLLGGGPQQLINKLGGAAETEAAAKTFADMIPAEGVQAIEKSKWSEYLKNSLAAQIGVDALKENAKATGLMTLDEAVGIGTQAMFNPQSVDAKNLGHDILNSAVHNFLTFAPISFFGAAVKDRHATQSNTEKEAIYRMGLDPAQYADYANEKVKEGTLQQADADKRIQLVNSMAAIHQSGDIPEGLSKSEKIQFGNALLHEKKLYNEINLLSSKPLIEIKDAQIKNVQDIQREILNNSTGIEKNADGKPIIQTNEILQNETKNNQNRSPEITQTEAIKNTEAVSNDTQAQVAKDLTAVDILKNGVTAGEVKGPYADLVKSQPEMAADVVKEIANQAQGVDASGNKLDGGPRYEDMVKENAYPKSLIDAAIKEHPVDLKKDQPIVDNTPQIEADRQAEINDIHKKRNLKLDFLGDQETAMDTILSKIKDEKQASKVIREHERIRNSLDALNELIKC